MNQDTDASENCSCIQCVHFCTNPNRWAKVATVGLFGIQFVSDFPTDGQTKNCL